MAYYHVRRVPESICLLLLPDWPITRDHCHTSSLACVLQVATATTIGTMKGFDLSVRLIMITVFTIIRLIVIAICSVVVEVTVTVTVTIAPSGTSVHVRTTIVVVVAIIGTWSCLCVERGRRQKSIGRNIKTDRIAARHFPLNGGATTDILALMYNRIG